MKVVILCGGYGTRIRDVSADLPKPMIPIGGLPVLWHIMKTYAHYGHRRFVLCLGYKADVIKDFFLNYQARTCDLTVDLGPHPRVTYHTQNPEEGWQVTLADTGLHAMTGARIKRIRRYIGDDDLFLLTYGDGVSDVDLTKLIAFHRAHGRAITVTGVHPPGRFGELDLGEQDQVVGFNEKPQVSGGRISGGYFVCSTRVFDFLSEREDLVFEQEPLRQLVAAGEMMVYRHDGFWQPMDTARDHGFLNQLWERGTAPWKIW